MGIDAEVSGILDGLYKILFVTKIDVIHVVHVLCEFASASSSSDTSASLIVGLILE